MHDHTLGNPKAAVRLVEYADFECPYCGMAYPYVKRIMNRFADTLELKFRCFPLVNIHPHGLHAAQAAEAAGLQDKFWEMHDILFEHQKQLDDHHLLEDARTLKLDIARFEQDFSSAGVRDAIQRGMQEGADQGVRGTPTFLLNGRQLELERFEQLEEIVEQAVSQAPPRRTT